MKKTLTILIILIVIAAGIGFYLISRPTPSGETGDDRGFFPVGNLFDFFTGREGDNAGQTISTPTNNLETEDIATPEKIIDESIAGYELITISDNDYLVYAEQSTGHIYTADLTDEELTFKRISNTTIANPLSVLFTTDTNHLYAFIEDRDGVITSINIPLEAISGETEKNNLVRRQSNFLAQPAINRETGRIFYLKRFNDDVVGLVANPDLSGAGQVWRTGLLSWQASWAGTGSIILSQPPAWSLSRNLYSLDLNREMTDKILSNKSGLTALPSPDGKQLLYSESAGNNLNLKLKNLDTGTEKTLAIKTLTDKCVWQNDAGAIYCGVSERISAGQYPDEWYQGKISFPNDDIWVYIIDDSTLFRLTSINRNLDVVNLKVKDNMIWWQNKKDGSLWSVFLRY
ncbi:MAG: hypothetical protein WDZ85_03160 [Candidatus Paceibacterota bacterium]